MMSVLICPECGAENQPDAETCWVCQALLAGDEPGDFDHPQVGAQNENDLLPQAAGDLPDLLRSLKQNGDLSDLSSPEGGGLPTPPKDDEGSESRDEIEDEPDVPEWLNRIRQRAQVEADAAGEVTQKNIAARESLDDDKKEDQHRQFESLIQKIQGEDAEESPGAEPEGAEQPDEGSVEGTEDADWLTRIRKKHRPAQAEGSQALLSEREGDSLLQWLVALEDGSADPEEAEAAKLKKHSDSAEDTQEIDLSLSAEDTTQEIAVGEPISARRKESELVISREEQTRADQLSATILDEKAPRPERVPERGFSPRWIRTTIGILLIAILSFALFFSAPVDLPSGTHRTQSLAALEWSKTLPGEASLLLILDYQAGYSAEMGMIAQPILDHILQDEREVSILFSTPAGSLLFNRLLVEVDLFDRLTVRDLGYYPVGSFGAYGLVSQVNASWQFRGQPAFLKALPAEPFDGILILADDDQGAKAWIEQFSSLAPETPILLLISAQAEPLLLPYWESGQVVGMVSGITDAVNIDGNTGTYTYRWHAYQVGIVMMIIMLLIGMSFPERHHHSEGRRDR